MFRVRVFVLLFLTLFNVGTVVKGEVVYNAAFSEDVNSCEDFDNKYMDATTLTMAPDGLGLGGKMNLVKDLPEEAQISFEIYKVTDRGPEYMAQLTNDVCQSLKDEDAPWYPLVKAMDLSGCPVPVKLYEIDRIDIEVGSLSDFLCHEYVGAYIVRILIMNDSKPPEPIVCYEVQVAIFEEND